MGQGLFAFQQNEGIRLINRIIANDKKAVIKREAERGNIASCRICKRPFPTRDPTKTYTCKNCENKEKEKTQIINKIICKKEKTPIKDAARQDLIKKPKAGFFNGR